MSCKFCTNRMGLVQYTRKQAFDAVVSRLGGGQPVIGWPQSNVFARGNTARLALGTVGGYHQAYLQGGAQSLGNMCRECWIELTTGQRPHTTGAKVSTVDSIRPALDAALAAHLRVLMPTPDPYAQQMNFAVTGGSISRRRLRGLHLNWEVGGHQAPLGYRTGPATPVTIPGGAAPPPIDVGGDTQTLVSKGVDDVASASFKDSLVAMRDMRGSLVGEDYIKIALALHNLNKNRPDGPNDSETFRDAILATGMPLTYHDTIMPNKAAPGSYGQIIELHGLSDSRQMRAFVYYDIGVGQWQLWGVGHMPEK